MKNVLLAILIALGITTASDNVISSGDNIISAGFHLDFDGDVAPGVAIAWDHGVGFAKSFTFGAQTSIGFFEHGVWLTPAFRAGFHPFAMPVLDGKVPIAPKFDPYVTMGIGTNIWLGDGDLDPNFHFRSAVGCYWMFSEKFGLWGEIGNTLIVGASLKL